MTTAQPGQRRIGEYEILSELNAGGMGEVLLARRVGAHNFEKFLAVKTIRKEHSLDPDLRAMFLDEARLVARLSHPAIAQVYDFGEEGNVLYLVMEHVSGISFKDLIGLRPDPLIAARAVAEVCLGLHAAHELTDLAGKHLGVVHRDVSPENLMLTFDGRVKILDFGIALMRDRETQATMLGQIKGTPSYMAPEQVTNDTIDRRTDIFILSIVLHELLSGVQLFAGDSLLATAMAIGNARIEPPSHARGPLPAGMNDVVMRGLERAPDRRFSSTLEMARALERVIKDQGKPLEQYAHQTLGEKKKLHLAWLRRVAEGQEEDPSEETDIGRPIGVATLPIGNGVPVEPEEDALEEVPTKETGMGWQKAVVLSALTIVLGALGALFVFGDVFTERGSDAPVVESPAKKIPPDSPPLLPPAAPVRDQESTKQEEKRPRNDPSTKQNKPARPSTRARSQANKSAKQSSTPKQESPVAVGHGYLTVGADPYALVRLDGRPIGTTPVIRYKVDVGEHTVVLVSPDDGAVRLKRKVRIALNQHQEVIVR